MEIGKYQGFCPPEEGFLSALLLVMPLCAPL